MIDWDAAVLAPLMAVFGEEPSALPLYQRAAGGVPFAVEGVFDDAFMAVMMNADGEPDIGSVEPVLGVRLAQFGGVDPVQGDQVTIPRVNKVFRVRDVQPDGKGWAYLPLTRIAP